MRDAGADETQLQSQPQPGSAAKAVFSLERSCPKTSMAPVLAIVWMVAGVVLKRIAARPRWGDCVGFADRAGPR